MRQTMTRRMGRVAVVQMGLVAVVMMMVVSLRMAQATGAGVQDAAGFFSADTIATAERQIAATAKKLGKDLRVETYARIPNDLAKQYTAEKPTVFFSTWAYQRAKAVGLDGVLVLICQDPPFVQVVVGDRTKQQAFTATHRDHMRDLLVTAFKQKHFDDGLLHIVTYYDQTLQATLGEPGAGARPSITPLPGPRPSVYTPPESPSIPQVSRGLFWPVVLLGGGGLILWWWLRRRSSPGEYRGAPPSPGYTPYEARGVPPGMGYPPADARYGGGWGGGFARGVGGGILGGLLGGWLGNRLARHDAPSSADASTGPFQTIPDEGERFDPAPGPDFSESTPTDFGGGGDFGGESEGSEEQGGGGSF